VKPGEIAALLVGPSAALTLYILLVIVVWDEPVAWTGVIAAIVAGLVGAAAGGTVVESVVLGGVMGVMMLVVLVVLSPPSLVRHGLVGLALGATVGNLTDAVFGAFRKVEHGDRPPGR
jgi:hypothetical protein